MRQGRHQEGRAGTGALTEHSDEAGESRDEEHAEGQGLKEREALYVGRGCGVRLPPGTLGALVSHRVCLRPRQQGRTQKAARQHVRALGVP